MDDEQVNRLREVQALLAKMDAEELNKVIGLVKTRRDDLGRETMWALGPGDRVRWDTGGRGRLSRGEGEVIKTMRSRVSVRTATGIVHVPATMLTRVD